MAVLDPEIGRSEQVVSLFLRLVPKQIAGIAEAVHGGDATAVRARAHKLKGGAAVIGATHLAESCQRLQVTAEEDDRDNWDQLVAEIRAAFADVRRELERS